jgi:hypothetical protein
VIKSQNDLQNFEGALVTGFSPSAIGVTVGQALKTVAPHYRTLTRRGKSATVHVEGFRRPTAPDDVTTLTVAMLVNHVAPEIACRVHFVAFDLMVSLLFAFSG